MIDDKHYRETYQVGCTVHNYDNYKRGLLHFTCLAYEPVYFTKLFYIQLFYNSFITTVFIKIKKTRCVQFLILSAAELQQHK